MVFIKTKTLKTIYLAMASIFCVTAVIKLAVNGFNGVGMSLLCLTALLLYYREQLTVTELKLKLEEQVQMELDSTPLQIQEC